MLTTELPGINQEDLDVTVTPESVTIAYETKDTDEAVNYRRRERHDLSFSRTVSLPVAVVPDGSEAKYEDGVLEIRLSRPDEQKPRKLEIKG